MFGFLVDKDNPVSIKKIIKELKKDRKASDRNFDYIKGKGSPSDKFDHKKFTRKSLLAYLNSRLSK